MFPVAAVHDMISAQLKCSARCLRKLHFNSNLPYAVALNKNELYRHDLVLLNMPEYLFLFHLKVFTT